MPFVPRWLERADAETIGQASTLLFVTLLRIEELGALRRKAKAVVDALDDGDVETARALLATTLEQAAEVGELGQTLSRLARKGPGT